MESIQKDCSEKLHIGDIVQRKPETFSENRDVAKRGGNIAGIARKALEQETGKSVISSKNAAQLNRIVTDMIEETTEIVSDEKGIGRGKKIKRP